MNLIRVAFLSLAVFGLPAGGPAYAEDSDPPVATDPQPEDDVIPDDDAARPGWTNPEQPTPTDGVNDDPTSFDPGTPSPDPNQ